MQNTSLFQTARRGSLIASLLAATLLATGCASMSSDPAQSVRILAPADGATVGTTFMVKFGAAGLKVEPAGDIVANSGHHHLLVNLNSITAGESIPFTEQHIHFGKAQTEAEVKHLLEQFETLRLKVGESVYVSPKKMRVFAPEPEYAI